MSETIKTRLLNPEVTLVSSFAGGPVIEVLVNGEPFPVMGSDVSVMAGADRMLEVSVTFPVSKVTTVTTEETRQ